MAENSNMFARADGWSWAASSDWRNRQREVAYVGVDPGAHGGLAISTRTDQLYRTMILPRMPRHDLSDPIPTHKLKSGKKAKPRLLQLTDFRVIASRLGPVLENFKTVRVCIERVWGRGGDGAQANFTFGMNYYATLAAFDLLGYTPEFVLPRVWKDAMLGERWAHDKVGARAAVKHRFGPRPIMTSPRSTAGHDGIADAVLISTWLARRYLRVDCRDIAEAEAALSDDEDWLK